MQPIWYRTITTTSGSTAIGFMKMSLFLGWTMADVSAKLLTQLYTYSPTNPWVRDA